MRVRYLDAEDLLAVAEAATGAAPQVRDIGLLDAAAHRPQASVFGSDAYPGVHLKAAALMESLVRGHPLVDGNKRLGWLATYVFLAMNGQVVEAPDDEAYDLVVGLAAGQRTLHEVASALQSWVHST